jgi:hypothetical protein
VPGRLAVDERDQRPRRVVGDQLGGPSPLGAEVGRLPARAVDLD